MRSHFLRHIAKYAASASEILLDVLGSSSRRVLEGLKRKLRFALQLGDAHRPVDRD
jgi:hypothetical protein